MDSELLAAAVEQGRVTLKVGGTEFLFRVPDLEDLAEIDADFPLLPSDEMLEETSDNDPSGVLKEITDDPAKTKRFMGRANSMLIKLALRPTLTKEFPTDPVEGELPVRAIKDNDRIATFITLMALAGFNQQAAVELVPLPGTARSSSTSTRSGGDTESSHTKYSTQGGREDTIGSSG